MEPEEGHSHPHKPLISAHHARGEQPPETPVRQRIYRVIFEADTPGGKAFDVALLVAILLSVVVVMLDSVASIRTGYGRALYAAEWVFTILFTLEYLFRLFSVLHPSRYAFSFYGIVDLLAVAPTYVSLILSGAQMLLVIRILRMLRLFRIFKLSRYIGEAHSLKRAMQASRYKITVFLMTVLSVVVIVGALMYLVEGPESGFTSIPMGIYWAIVTMTTVGYGDIAPRTVLGQGIAATLMILGYGIIAVPTGIVSAELVQSARDRRSEIKCPACGTAGHDEGAHYCMKCGASLLET